MIEFIHFYCTLIQISWKTMEEQKYLFKNPINHLDNLNNMRLSGMMCDVTIKAHKNILAASLKYFDSRFSNSFRESKQDVITMQDVKKEDLEAFISFAYTGELLLTDSNAIGLLELADYLAEDVIKDACINFLVKNLKKEGACRTYKLANAVRCNSLKTASKLMITSHFEYCSQTAEYFDFDCESLKDILISTNAAVACSEVHKLVFEGVMRWIMHDAKSRRIWMNDLLGILKITKLNAEVLDYLCNYAENQDYEDVVKSIMSFYRKRKQEIKQTENLEQILMIMNCEYKKLQVQFYNFTKTETWCEPYEIGNCKESDYLENWTIFNDEIYYTIYNNRKNATKLLVFNPAKKENKTLPFGCRLSSHRAMCSCSRFLYFCGGDFGNYPPVTTDVRRYDSLTKSIEILPPMRDGRLDAAAIFYQGCIHVLGGDSPRPVDDLSSQAPIIPLSKVEKYDPDMKVWMDFPSMCEKRSLHAVAVLDGKLYACGGMYKNSVEVYDSPKKKWRLVASMKKVRYHFSVVPHKGKLLAIGGDIDCKQTVEVYLAKISGR